MTTVPHCDTKGCLYNPEVPSHDTEGCVSNPEVLPMGANGKAYKSGPLYYWIKKQDSEKIKFYLKRAADAKRDIERCQYQMEHFSAPSVGDIDMMISSLEQKNNASQSLYSMYRDALKRHGISI